MVKYCCGWHKVIEPSLFQALSDQNRMLILEDLAGSRNMTKSVSEIASGFVVDISVISRHLSILRNAGVLTSFRQGKQVFYTLQANSLAIKLRQLANTLDSCCKKPKK